MSVDAYMHSYVGTTAYNTIFASYRKQCESSTCCQINKHTAKRKATQFALAAGSTCENSTAQHSYVNKLPDWKHTHTERETTTVACIKNKLIDKMQLSSNGVQIANEPPAK